MGVENFRRYKVIILKQSNLVRIVEVHLINEAARRRLYRRIFNELGL